MLVETQEFRSEQCKLDLPLVTFCKSHFQDPHLGALACATFSQAN